MKPAVSAILAMKRCSYGFKKILGFYVSGFNKDHLVLSMF